MEQALITHFKYGICPILICQWARQQHVGLPDPDVTMTPVVSESITISLFALLHRYFDLCQIGSDHDIQPCLTQDLVNIWYPRMIAIGFVPLECLEWLPYTTNWFSHVPKLPHTYFLIDQVFNLIHAFWQHPPIAWV